MRESKEETAIRMIDDVSKIAGQHGGKCLSTSEDYENNKTLLSFVCRKGHHFKMNANNIKSGKWCSICRRAKAGKKRRKGIEAMYQLAEKRNIKCLSGTYTNTKTPLTWECNVCHTVWNARPGNIYSGGGCPKCAEQKRQQSNDARRLTLEDAQALAKKKNGKCLSESYTNNSQKLLWECDQQHQWYAPLASVKGTKNHVGTWCPYCSHNIVTIEDMQKLAETNNGKCLSKEYLGEKGKLEWECKNHHRWFSSPAMINKGCWCKQCLFNSRGYTIAELQAKAQQNGGELLSKKYEGSTFPLVWLCGNGHQFLKPPTKVMTMDEWCPYCKEYINEERCRYIFEKIFNDKFPKDHQALDGLELDGYCEDLKIAFEHDGPQHERIEKYFNMTEEKLKSNQQRDSDKDRKCKEKGILLIRIPFRITKSSKMTKLFDYIISELNRNNVHYDYDPTSFSYSDFWYSICRLKEIQKIAHKNGGKCLTNEFCSKQIPIELECAKGHKFKLKYKQLMEDEWCSTCKKLKIKKKYLILVE